MIFHHSIPYVIVSGIRSKLSGTAPSQFLPSTWYCARAHRASTNLRAISTPLRLACLFTACFLALSLILLRIFLQFRQTFPPCLNLLTLVDTPQTCHMRYIDLGLGIGSLAKGISQLPWLCQIDNRHSLCDGPRRRAATGCCRHADWGRHGGLDMLQRPSVWRGCSNQANDVGTNPPALFTSRLLFHHAYHISLSTFPVKITAKSLGSLQQPQPQPSCPRPLLQDLPFCDTSLSLSLSLYTTPASP